VNVHGAIAVERPTVVIVSDEPEFLRAVSSRWQLERVSPSFLLCGSDYCRQLQNAKFDLAIIGGMRGEIGPELETLQALGKPVVHVSRPNGHLPKFSGAVEIPEVDGWPEMLITIAKQVLEREKIACNLARLSEARSQLEREASLGRYILEMRHSLNNALTSILGNSELMLMNDQSISPSLRLQLETIRNMGLRMNEILQRFSSLQKEMQLVEQQSSNRLSRSGAASV
jgi:signal transduction histidine kinase